MEVGVHYEPEPNTGCWLWLKQANAQVYGVHWNGERQVLAHRAMYESAFGPIPEGMVVMHTCDTPCCVNPAHLMIGTRADNSRDMAEKRRSTIGERNPMAKLTDEQARQILDSDLPQKDLAEMFGISKQSVCDIKHHRTWRRV